MEDIRIDQIPHPKPVLVKSKLRALIDQGVYPPGSQLPAETKLADMLGVSRTTLREVLHLLEEDGVLLRRQGIGTYVRKTHSFVLSPLEASAPPSVIIRSAGANPGTRSIEIAEEQADVTAASRLSIEPGSVIVKMKKVRTADSVPVLYSIDMFEKSILGDEDVPLNIGESVANFIEEMCDKRAVHSECKVVPVVADNTLSKKLQVELHSPIFLIDTIEYDEGEHPLIYCLDYWVSDFVDFRITRRTYRETEDYKAT